MATRTFRNLDGSGPPKLGRVLRWAVGERVTGRRRKAPARAHVPTVAADLALLATPPAVGEAARLTWLGHASWLVQLDGVSLVIDPVLRDALPGFIRRNVPAAIPPDRLPRIDASLVSHNHYDHLELPTLRQIGARVLSGMGAGAIFQGAPPCTELEWWQTEAVGSVKVTFVPSQHWSRRGVADTNQALWGGFVIEGSAATLYHSGDTAYFEGFKLIGQRFPGIDGAMLPIGAYDPRWFMRAQHMDPEDATQAFVDLKARTFLAMHWGTFKLTDEPLDEPPQRLEESWAKHQLPQARKRVLAIGETVRVGH